MKLGEKSLPLVTVLICNYNYGEYIKYAVDSALNQTWKNIEVIVVDDGSTDTSRNVLEEYKENIITIFKENRGQASAFNVGVSAAKGDIICFLDSDDSWHQDKVSFVVQKYMEGDYGLVCHDLRLINDRGEALGDTWSNYAEVNLMQGKAIDILIKSDYEWVFSPTAGMSIPTNLAMQIFPLPEAQWRICADSPMAYMAACLAPVGLVNEKLGYYRIHAKNEFALPHEDMVANRVASIIHTASGYLFTISHVNEHNRHRIPSPKVNYKYYRRCCYIARSKPWSLLFTLCKRNIIYHSSLENSNYLETLLSIVKYMLSDTIIAAGLFFRIPFKHQRYRSLFAAESEKLEDHVLIYILQDDEDDKL